MNRIPAITVWFWLIKTMITSADVVWPDYLYAHLGQVPVTGLIGLALVVTLTIQFRVRRYRALAFWPATVVVSVAGTEAANGIHDTSHLSYAWITLLYLAVLIALLAWWRIREGTLSPRSIDTRRREAFYWAVAFIAFAAGTALGHAVILRQPLGLGIWAGIIGCVAVAWKWLRLSPPLAFWACFVLTRPLGTSVALALTGLGRWTVSAAFGAAVIILVGWLAFSRRDELAHSAVSTDRGC